MQDDVCGRFRVSLFEQPTTAYAICRCTCKPEPLKKKTIPSLAGKAGLEPATYGLENRSSIR